MQATIDIYALQLLVAPISEYDKNLIWKEFYRVCGIFSLDCTSLQIYEWYESIQSFSYTKNNIIHSDVSFSNIVFVLRHNPPPLNEFLNFWN